MKKINSIFEVLGPIMIGPSSSHTAGAARLAKIARDICEQKIVKIKFYLHGSFAQTYHGHGTDRALVAGILGFNTDDPRLRDSLELASAQNLKYEFIPTDLGFVHPNTIKFEMEDLTGKVTTVVGSSIGGGNVQIIKINDFDVLFTGEYDTLIAHYYDFRGMVREISSIFTEEKINIANMNVTRYPGAKEVTAIIELDSEVNDGVLVQIREIPHMLKVIKIDKSQSL